MVKNLVLAGLVLAFFTACADNSIKMNRAELGGFEKEKKAAVSNLNCKEPRIYEAELPCGDCWALHSNLKICGDKFELTEYYDGAKASEKKDFVTLGKIEREHDIWTLRANSNLNTKNSARKVGQSRDFGTTSRERKDELGSFAQSDVVRLKNLGGGSLIRLTPSGEEPSGALREYYIYRAR